MSMCSNKTFFAKIGGRLNLTLGLLFVNLFYRELLPSHLQLCLHDCLCKISSSPTYRVPCKDFYTSSLEPRSPGPRSHSVKTYWGILGGANGKEPACKCRRHKRCRFDPWVTKIPWRKAWWPTPIHLPRESHGQRNLVGYSPWGLKSQTWLSY